MSDTAINEPVRTDIKGGIVGNVTNPGAAVANPALSPQSPLANMGPPPAPPAPPNYPQLNIPPRPQIPTEKQLGPAPDARDYQKGAMEFASAMAIIGAIAGRFTRQPGGAALGAFAAALKGWKEGNLQAYTDAANKWEQDTKAAIENNKQELEHYRLVLEDRKMNIDDQMSQIQLIATRYHNDIMYNLAQQKNYTAVGQAYEKNWEYTYGEKGMEATAAPLIRENKEITTKLQNTALKMITGEIPMETDAQGNRLPQSQILNNRFILERFGPPPPKYAGGMKGELIAQENAERAARGEPPMTATQARDFGLAPPRSAPAMALRKFMERHPDADENQITQFSAIYNAAQSRARTLGTRGGNVDLAVDEASKAAKQALARSAEVPRGEFVPINRLSQEAQKAGSSPALKRFEIANASLITAYSQTMSRTGVNTVTAQNRATELLSTATGPEAYKAGVEQLMTEMEIVQQAVRDVQGGTPVQSGGEAAPAGGIPAGWGVEVH